MRCYLMRKGVLWGLEFLTAGNDDSLIEEAQRIFRERTDRPFDGFEVWDGARRVHVHVAEAPTSS